MVCRLVKTPGGGNAFVCGPAPRAKKCTCGSGRATDLLCDWKTPAGASATCDKLLCAQCSHKPAPDKDLCPAHAFEWQVRQAFRQDPPSHQPQP